VSGVAGGLVLRRGRRMSHWSEWHWTAVWESKFVAKEKMFLGDLPILLLNDHPRRSENPTLKSEWRRGSQTLKAEKCGWLEGQCKYTDPLSATLTHFSRSQTHFWPENRKPKIHITLSFMIRFWLNFVGMDPHRTPSCWPPIFRWPWPTSSGQTRNRPEIFCHRFGQI